ncbi:MAG: hypothetical protein ACXV8L_04035 [Ilumatobacteraceae bacterium]
MTANLLPRDGERAIIERHVPGRPTRTICSLATGRHRQLLAESASTLAAYAQRHGWSLVLSSEKLGERPPSWTKLTLVQQLLGHNEFVFWVDADAVIVDLERDILAEINDDADIWFARHPQERNPQATVLNAGVFLARSCEFTRELLGAMWANEQFIDHNWWENAALLDLLGYSLDPPFPKLRPSHWDARIGELDLAWNSVPGYCESPHPAINHHARSDHDDFGLRLNAMANDRQNAMARFPAVFEHVRSPSSAGVDGGPRRTHEFDGLHLGEHPPIEELLAVIDTLDTDNEAQRLRLMQVYDQLETAVTEQVANERRADQLAADVVAREQDHQLEVARLRAELDAVHNTKLVRIARPLRALYGRVLRRRRG